MFDNNSPTVATKSETGWFPSFAIPSCYPLFRGVFRCAAFFLRPRVFARSNPARFRARLESVRDADEALVSCGGGGIFLFWQIGAARAVSEVRQGRTTYWAGTSAGALCAALTLCHVEPLLAIETAHRLALERDLYRRPLGLLGVWGEILRQWLDVVLPPDADVLCGNLLTIQVTEWRGIRAGLRVRRISNFSNRSELIDVLMASVHIPLFLDGSLWASLPRPQEKSPTLAFDGSALWFVPLPARRYWGVNDSDLTVTNQPGIEPNYFITHLEDEEAVEGPKFLELIGIDSAIELCSRGYSFTKGRILGS